MSEVLNTLLTSWEAGLASAGLTSIELAWVAAGSGLGGVARFLVSGIVARRVGETFPWGTLIVNVTGAFMIGGLAAVAAGGLFSLPGSWPFAVVGLIGSYTTVSSFSLQTLALARNGEHWRAAWNVLASLTLCLSAVALGAAVGGAGIRWLAT